MHMKIYAIKNENDKKHKNLAYLLYYEKDKKFYIEIDEKVNPEKLPIVLSIFSFRRIYTVNAYWTKMWIKERIVPTDRQNLGQILKDANLDHYDEYQLLMKTNGRCAQDDCYLEKVKEEDLPKEIVLRFQRKVSDVIPLKDNQLLVFFRDGSIRKIQYEDVMDDENNFKRILKDKKIFEKVEVETGGQGITWDEDSCIPCERLYASGKLIPLNVEDLKSFIEKRVIDTNETGTLVGCSKQNVEDLVKRGRLEPIKQSCKYKLFLKSEVLERIWK